MWSLPDPPDATSAQDDGRYLSSCFYGVRAIETTVKRLTIDGFDSTIVRATEMTSFAAAAQQQAFVAIDRVQALTQTLLSGAEAFRVAEPMSFLTDALEKVTRFTDMFSEVNRFAVWDNLTVSWVDQFEPTEIERISFYLNLSLSQNVEVEPDKKIAALDRMVDRFWWVGTRPGVRRALARRARESGTSPTNMLHNEVRSAILLALGTSTHPQVIRFGTQWVCDDQGKMIAVVPDQLEDDWYFKWFKMAVARMVQRSLEELPDRVPTRNSRSLEEPENGVVGLPDGWEDLCPGLPEDDPLVLLVERDEQDDARRQLAACLNLATRRQRETLHLLDQGLTIQEAAHRLGIAESTVRGQLKRLRDRAKASGLVA